MALWRVLSVAAAAHAGTLGERPELRADAVGYTGGWGSVGEVARLEMRSKAGWKWEFPGEGAAYAARQERRLAEILALEHYQERLDNFVQYTQVRSVPNFTETGFAVVQIDEPCDPSPLVMRSAGT